MSGRRDGAVGGYIAIIAEDIQIIANNIYRYELTHTKKT